jgi:hypothetical protein
MSGFSREEHERGLALFLERQHRARFRAALADDKLRRKLRNKLAHFAWLDERYVESVATTDAETMARQLHGEGAPSTCVLVAQDHLLDGRELALQEALRAVLHDGDAALLSCLPGRLAVFSDEAPNQQTHVLRRE